VHRRFRRPSIPALLVIVVPLIAIIVGLVVPGGTGNTITAIGGAALAFGILIDVGIPNSRMNRPGNPGPFKRD
jgi:hypothetical protein